VLAECRLKTRRRVSTHRWTADEYVSDAAMKTGWDGWMDGWMDGWTGILWGLHGVDDEKEDTILHGSSDSSSGSLTRCLPIS